MALEFAAKGVRVNAVCPATIETEMTEKLSKTISQGKIYGDAPNRPVWAIGAEEQRNEVRLAFGVVWFRS